MTNRPLAIFSNGELKIDFSRVESRRLGKERFWLANTLRIVREGRKVLAYYKDDGAEQRLKERLVELGATPEELSKFTFTKF